MKRLFTNGALGVSLALLGVCCLALFSTDLFEPDNPETELTTINLPSPFSIGGSGSASSSGAAEKERLKSLARVLHRLNGRVAKLKRELSPEGTERRRRRHIPHITVIVKQESPSIPASNSGPKDSDIAVPGLKSLKKGLNRIFSGFRSAIDSAGPTKYWHPRRPKVDPEDDLAKKKNSKSVTGNSAPEVKKQGSPPPQQKSLQPKTPTKTSSKEKGKAAAGKSVKKPVKKKKKKCVGPLCGQLWFTSEKETGPSHVSNYLVTTNMLTLKWRGGGVKSRINIDLFRYDSFESRRIVKVMARNIKNVGKFVWRVPEDLPAGDRYLVRIQAVYPREKKKNGKLKKLKKESVRTDWLTIEPYSNWGQRGRQRHWRTGGGPDS